MLIKIIVIFTIGEKFGLRLKERLGIVANIQRYVVANSYLSEMDPTEK